ncbi:MAG: hypothetical protein WCT32_02875 [Patescibacteria group bacterium]|jgi:hypothetical protein
MGEDYDQIEEVLIKKEQDERKQQMPVSGKSVFLISKILHRSAKAKKRSLRSSDR